MEHKFEVVVDKHFNIREIWFDNKKLVWIENIRLLCTPQGTRVTFQILPRGIKFKFRENEYGT